ncbi:MAG: hypothetical protein HeimC2_43500 [Candidatus Heimdallarchaeota archaeon LC_2]|nr:MAG: hypothetical protein HeimC2_43500 [Candidatus Heimdallarchaeota archaeon LC_2]
MSMKTEKGYLVLGDITGYTSYVATTELEHSQEILTELLQLIIKNFQTLLTIVKVEGDAIFACAETTSVPNGENILDLVESTYSKFRNRVENIVYKTSCDCNACRAIPNLDLKFFIHYGDYVAQNFGGIRDLVGTDVNLIHRLMKNKISDLTGWTAYALFTEIAISEINLPRDQLFKHEETIEHLGSVMTYNLDLHKYYKKYQQKNSLRITLDNADKTFSYEFEFTPTEVWNLVTDPTKRNIVNTDNIWSVELRPNGRAGIGATNHCAHGDGEITNETILDWNPFEYFTVETHIDIDQESPLDAKITYELIPNNNNLYTTLNLYFQFRDNSNKEAINGIFPIIQNNTTRIFNLNSEIMKKENSS